MKDQLSDFFLKEFPFHKEGLDEFMASFKVKYYKKKSLLLSAGQKAQELRFLNEGVVREYYQSDGKESNINFYDGPQFVTDFSAFNRGATTLKYQECLTEIEVRVMAKSTFLELLETYECGGVIVQRTFERLLAEKEKSMYSRLMKTPEELYQQIAAKKANWLQKVPQYHIASYLGVTPETLSRIRSKMR
ncbi:Crp/Fnr family transcriptional regulator [Lewinella cohaerens]|uniref:Crp/Fnr family transcriptional regulator n=1 Tax=Lewinella cohaerens TaxID=70995 RepID=UPI00036E70A0|nr:Crp/Fnr family transcriptional regulator [Lewinella cohaerens]